MKTKHSVIGAFLWIASAVCTNAFAQWVKPAPNISPRSEGVEGYLYNTDAKAFFIGANEWQTRASVSETKGYILSLNACENGEQNCYHIWNYVETNGGWYDAFVERDIHVWVDYHDPVTDASRHWIVSDIDDTHFTIRNNYASPMSQLGADGSNLEDTRLYLIGPDGYTSSSPLTTWAFVTPDDYNEWQEENEIYTEAVELGKLIELAKANYPRVDISTSEAVYKNNNSTAYELRWAKEDLQSKIDNYEDSLIPGVNMTGLLVNPAFTNGYWGWNSSYSINTGGLYSFPSVETYENKIDIWQEVEDVPNGIYKVTVNAFYRPSGNGSYDGTESVPVNLFLNDFNTPVMHIMDDALPGEDAVEYENCMPGVPNEGFSGSENSDYYTFKGYVPNGMAGASYAFRAGRYLQTTYGVVTDGRMRIGLTSNNQKVHWCLWSNFKLRFMDKDEDAENEVISSLVGRCQNSIDRGEYSSSLASYISAKMQKAQNAATVDAKYDAILELNSAMNEVAAASIYYGEKLLPAYNRLTEAMSDFYESASVSTKAIVDAAYKKVADMLDASAAIATEQEVDEMVTEIENAILAMQNDIDSSVLLVNEIQVANVDMFMDQSFNYGGWIEIYNPSSVNIGLNGFYISDDPSNLTKHQLSNDIGVVPAHGFKTIWFDHYSTDDEFSSEAYKQVNFKLAYEGGTIYLSNNKGECVASQVYPQAISRTSYARTKDGAETWAFTSTPTPDASNNNCSFATERLAAPMIDKDATVFNNPFTVNVDIPAGAILRYTTDGSTPTLERGETSEDGVFYVDYNYTTTYRFRLFKDGYLPSAVVTRSYIYDDRGLYLPIVSLNTNWENLYDDYIGVYVDGNNGTSGNNNPFSNKNRGWERPVNFEYLVPNEYGEYSMMVNQEVDFEVCGGWTRHYYPAASFRLKAGKYYEGLNSIDYPFFDNKPFNKTKTLQIRNGGNDNYDRIWDAGIHQVIQQSGFYLDCQAWQPAHIFINGKYRFMFNIREPNNKNFGYSNYGIDTDEMDQFEINGSKGYEQKVGDDAVFRQWMDLAQQLADDPGNDDIYNQICELVDIDEYINYMAAECYVGSGDWLTNSNNVKGYRSKADGKFHLVFMDVDAGFGSHSMLNDLSYHLYDSRYDTGKNFLIDIFLNMLQNEKFKKQFIDAFCLVDGSVFEDNNVSRIISSMAEKVQYAMEWEGSNVIGRANALISNIISGRESRINNMSGYFGLYDQKYKMDISSNVEGSRILLNDQDMPTGKLNGYLFPPFTLTAKAPAGYKFKGWKVVGESVSPDAETLFPVEDSWAYYDQGSMDGTGWKNAAFDDSGWNVGNGGLGYGNVGKNGYQDWQTMLDYGGDSSNKTPTYYFRKSFNVSELPDENTTYVLRTYVDDGFVAYLNGEEIGRYHMASGVPYFDQYSTTYEGQTAANVSIEINGNLLRKGENVLAIEVHNTSASSSDIYWDAALVKVVSSSQESYVSAEESVELSSLIENGTYRVVAEYEEANDEIDIATSVRVNEVSAGNTVNVNTDYYKKDDWVELYNATDSPVDVAGMYLSDDESQPQKFQIPDNDVQQTIIAPHGHLVVWASKRDNLSDQIHANFKLSNYDGETVILTSEDGTWSSALNYVAHAGHESVGRYPDGGNDVYHTVFNTIGKSNTITTNSNYLYSFESTPSLDDKFTLSLTEGWNWVSHPLERSIMTSEIADNAVRILGQTSELYNDAKLGWTGTLTSLAPTAGYKINMALDSGYSFDGPFFAEGNTIALKKGWNWIGYPIMGTQSLSAALAQFKPSEGDVMVGHEGFATYENGSWSGTLEMLHAGAGYLYKSASPKTLKYAHPSGKTAAKARFHVQPRAAWTANASAYPNVMGLVATIVGGQGETESGAYSVGAFDADGVCRGVGKYIDGKLFITVYGESDESISFKAAEAGTGIVYDVAETFSFASDVKGSRTQPVALTIGDATGIASVKSSKAVQSMQYYTTGGTNMGANKNSLGKGIYIAKYQLVDGSVLTNKVVIK